MVRRSKRLERVHTLAASEERDYCRAMGEAQRRLDQHLGRLEELKAYRREYAARQAPGQGGAAVSSVRYADYRNFLERLDDAVRAQAEVVMTTEKSRDAHRERWMRKRRKSESLQRVVDRCRADESRAEERLRQKALDDLPLADDPFRRF